MANTLSPLLDKCSNMEQLKQIQARMIKSNHVADALPMNKLLHFCASSSSGDLVYAQTLFERIKRPDTFMFNSMIKGYSISHEPEQALVLYSQMLTHSVPHNSFTFPFLVKACSTMDVIHQIHAHIVKFGFASEVYTVNALLHVYATKGNDIKSACLLFQKLDHRLRDVVTYNSMINGCIRYGDMELGYEIFREHPEKNIVSWTTMISGYVEQQLYKKALNLFQDMQNSGVKPDHVALTCALTACGHIGDLDRGKWIHAFIQRSVTKHDSKLGCALIDMYGRCGNMKEAIKVFGKMEEKNVQAWTALISGFGINGDASSALYWFNQMQIEGINPNQVTFTVILKACSYAGLVERGKLLFQSMNKVYGLTPTIEHYGCMVDLLGRAGLLKEAKDVIETMPMKPNAVIWGAFLNACIIHGNVELGKQIGKTITELDPNHGGRYIQLANVHAAAGEFDKAVEARRVMRELGVSKLPGCSTISLNGLVHEFYAGDRYHPNTEEIYHKWGQITERLRREGYRPTMGNLLLDFEERAIHHHSEKLAISLGLIKTKAGETIRIFKNLRICKDCHNVAKLISKIYTRTIIMRDRVRFHHFTEGKCSCGDYW